MTYEALDAALVGAISEQQPIPFHRLEVNRDVAGAAAQAQAQLPVDRWKEPQPVFRIIDRRLQALRKRGVIVSTRAGWTLFSHKEQ